MANLQIGHYVGTLMTNLKYCYASTWLTCHQRKAVSIFMIYGSDAGPADPEPTPLI